MQVKKMKNKFNLLIAIVVFTALILGCSFYNPLSGSSENGNSAASKDKSFSGESGLTTDEEDKIGIPECDEVIDFFAEQSNSPDDNFITRGTKGYFFNKIRESFKESIKENKDDKVKMAKECVKYKKQLDKYKAEEESNKK